MKRHVPKLDGIDETAPMTQGQCLIVRTTCMAGQATRLIRYFWIGLTAFGTIALLTIGWGFHVERTAENRETRLGKAELIIEKHDQAIRDLSATTGRIDVKQDLIIERLYNMDPTKPNR